MRQALKCLCLHLKERLGQSEQTDVFDGQEIGVTHMRCVHIRMQGLSDRCHLSSGQDHGCAMQEVRHTP